MANLKLNLLLLFAGLLPLALSFRHGPQARIGDLSGNSCLGRRTYTLPLPSKFNTDLIYNSDKAREEDESKLGWPVVKHLRSLAMNDGLGKKMKSPPGPKSLAGAWYQTDQNALELLFFHRMKSYPCQVSDYRDADLVYVPFLGGHDAFWNMASDVEAKDRLALELVQFMKSHGAWKRSNGSDHFMVLGRPVWDFLRTSKWGSSLMVMDGVQNNVWTVTVETAGWLRRVVSVPRPTGFHPRSHHQVQEWQHFVRGQERQWLFSFAGGRRSLKTEEGVLREKLFWQCKGSQQCAQLDCSAAEKKGRACENINVFFDQYLRSTFCLHPRGDSCTRRSVIDAALAGCIPVVFSSCSLKEQLQWHFRVDKKQPTSIFINSKDVKGPEDLLAKIPAGSSTANMATQGHVLIEDVLKAIPEEEVRKMRERIISNIPKLIFGVGHDRHVETAPDFEDAISVTIDSLVKAALPRRQSS